MPDNVELKLMDELALIALQGPKAVSVLASFAPEVEDMAFMSSLDIPVKHPDGDLWMHVSRSGYTGEDGYELSIKAPDVGKFWQMLIENKDVEAIGLGRAIAYALKRVCAFMAMTLIQKPRPLKPGSHGPSVSAAANRAVSPALTRCWRN